MALTRIDILGALSAEVLCSVEADVEHGDVVELKLEVERLLGVPEAQQRLLAKGRVLRNHEDLRDVFGDGQEVRTVSLIRISAEWAKMLLACERGDLRLSEMAAEYRADRELVLASFRRSGNVIAGRQGGLALVSKELRGDREVVLSAVAFDGHSLGHASASLRADREVVLAAVRQDGTAFVHAAAALRRDRGVILAAVRQNGFVLEMLPAELRADREVAVAAVRGCGPALEFVAAHLKEDWDLVADAVHENSAAVKFAAKALQQSSEFRRYVVQRGTDNPWMFSPA
mmetsp:Transcript_65618/g.184781  ORF Transcript_65618/g.184781 Transcript_65618/m.184781 type:complete len:287 (-) Transcript_65618:23-883(-)